MDTLRTISVRLPVAMALIQNRSGILGKWCQWDNPVMALHCSVQVGRTKNHGNNKALQGYLRRHGLLRAPLPELQPGHVFGVARLRRLQGVQGMDSQWAGLWGDCRWLYLVESLSLCEPFKWRGVMSCFPVPRQAFKMVHDGSQET